MRQVIALLFLTTVFNNSVLGQYSLARETVVPKSKDLMDLQQQRFYYPAGQNGEFLVYQFNRKSTVGKRKSAEAILKVYYDERSKKILDSFKVQNDENKILRFSQLNDLMLFRGFYKVSENLEDKTIDDLDRGEFLVNRQDIWIEKNGKEVNIKSYQEHYSDKDVAFQIGGSGKYVILNTFVSQYLRSTDADSTITIFNVAKGTSREITCKECIAPQIIGDYIYYGQKFFYMRGADVYDWKIYRAPITNLSKTELLGEYIELLFISPDGSYILGKKLLDGEETMIILDIKSRKFQYLLGRSYNKLKFFYSPSLKKIAFDRENDIIYIDQPNQFPFSAIGSDAKPKRFSTDEASRFWEKFKFPN